MLTEYSTYDDIRKFRDKASAKFNDMIKGHLGKAIRRKKLEWKKIKSENRQPFYHKFRLDGQELEVLVLPIENEYGRLKDDGFFCNVFTFVDTNNGKTLYEFLPNKKTITISSPHYIKRNKERHVYEHGIKYSENFPYIRNGRKYELVVCGENVIVCRRVDDDIMIYITLLTKDMCTSNNFQSIFAQAGKVIDEHDIYEWK